MILCLRAQNYSQHDALGSYYQLIRIDVSDEMFASSVQRFLPVLVILAECLDLWNDGERIQGNLDKYAYVACISLTAFLLGFQQACCWIIEFNR